MVGAMISNLDHYEHRQVQGARHLMGISPVRESVLTEGSKAEGLSCAG